jgi:hypothetical protein
MERHLDASQWYCGLAALESVASGERLSFERF